MKHTKMNIVRTAWVHSGSALRGCSSPRLKLTSCYQKYKHHKEKPLKKTHSIVSICWLQYDPITIKAKRKVKLEVQSKIFSCTPWQNYSELFGLYNQQNVQFTIVFIFFLINIKIDIENKQTNEKKNQTKKVSNLMSRFVILQ